jgi:acetyltransferase-like isoleucine patch superfamily enzyme
MNLVYLWAKMCKKIRGSAIINSRIHKTSKVEAGSNIHNSSMDRYSFCGYDCTIVNCDIGAFCSIANNVSIGQFDHPMEWVSMSPVFYEGRDSITKKFSTHYVNKGKRTVIGNDVWIGEGALIKAGVTIGDGAVIGMGSVVTKDIDKYTIVAGNPATIIRKRFDDQTIEVLSQIKWWEFSEEQLYKYAQYFNNVPAFIKEVVKE